MSITTPETRRPRSHAAKASRAETLHSSWETRSACYNRPSQWWDDEAPQELQEKARKACRGCPVLAQCLDRAKGAEGGYDVGRTNVVAALTGRQRDWLHRQSRKHGAFDAEEARLLALESEVSGRPVQEIAEREGVGGLTLRLAGKMLPAGSPEPAPAVSVDGLKSGERVLMQMEEVLEWRYSGVSLDEIARRLGVTRRTASNAIKKYLGTDKVPGPRVVSQQEKEERIEEIAAHRRANLSWVAIDALTDLKEGTTYRFVSRWRDEVEKRGGTVPRELQREGKALTRAEVLHIRERALAGVSDIDQAMELGMACSIISSIVSGERYRRYGGPIRPKREVGTPRQFQQPSLESRVLFNGGQAGFLKDAA